MLKPNVLVFLLVIFVMPACIQAQDKIKPKQIKRVELLKVVPSLAKQLRLGRFEKADSIVDTIPKNPKKRYGNMVVPGKGFPKGDDPLFQPDEKTTYRSYVMKPKLVFNAAIPIYSPSDPTGAVGPNHYLGAWNTSFRIFDKQGKPLIPEASFSIIFTGNTAGDPIVLYDAAADRFIITEFDQSPNGFNIAISQGPDPVNDDWYVYTVGLETGSFPDYPKFSIWHDAYYVTSNIPTQEFESTGDRVFAIEREAIIAGKDAGFISFDLPGMRTNGFYSPQFLNVGNPEMPSSGPATVVYMQDDSWNGIVDDHLKLWSVNLDWKTPENSTISNASVLFTADFNSVFDGGSTENLSQPGGPDLDALQATIMNQAQFRQFANYNAAVFNFVVDVDGSSGEKAGIRWFELRQTGANQPWSIYQEGTYTAPGDLHAFAGSMNIDKDGSIALGYTTVSTTEKIAIKYTGRYANDPLGEMTVPETLIAQGSGNDNSSRYADYTHMTLDPVDQHTFWFISEYFNPNRRDVVGVFNLSPDYAKDLQVTAIMNPVSNAVMSSSESITIRIRNAGSAAQSNFPVSYHVDNGTVVTETFMGSLAFNEYADFTFSQTADLSNSGQIYTITAATVLSSDEDKTNDELVEEVLNAYQKDVGVSEIISPSSKDGLSSAEPVTVVITNYGAQSQSGFEIYYKFDGGANVTETFSGTVASGATAEFTFSTTIDFAELRNYTLKVGTSLVGDENPENDAISKTFANIYCEPQADCEGYGDGVTVLELGGLRIDTDCNGTGYIDETDTVFEVDMADTPIVGQLQIGYYDSSYAIFIDFNDDVIFQESELVASGSISNPDVDYPFTFIIPEGTPEGVYRMRVRGKDNAYAGDLADPCGDISFGRTNDFSIKIVKNLSIEENTFVGSQFTIIEGEKNHFDLKLNTTQTNANVLVNVFNLAGQKLVHNWLPKEGGLYTYDLDMSYAASGVYILKMGNDDGMITRKIIVK